jgi:hypothetical protein
MEVPIPSQKMLAGWAPFFGESGREVVVSEFFLLFGLWKIESLINLSERLIRGGND